MFVDLVGWDGVFVVFFFQAEDGIRDLVRSRGLGDVYKRQGVTLPPGHYWIDWQVDGDINYTGPWQPPVTIDGQLSLIHI